jgi:hypothetical protein
MLGLEKSFLKRFWFAFFPQKDQWKVVLIAFFPQKEQWKVVFLERFSTHG